MPQNYTERRKYPRLNKNLPLSIKAKGYDFITETKNISCMGAYCFVDGFIEPMTKLSIDMELPLRLNNKRKSLRIHCQGTVVRVEEAHASPGYNIAIFFNRISDSDKRKISQYISQFITV